MESRCHILKHLHRVDIAMGVVFSVTLVVPLIISLASKRTYGMPYISDLGAFSPEAAIFTFGWCISFALTVAVTLMRYLNLREMLAKEESKAVHRLNKASLGFGLAATVCFVGIAAFPVNAVLEMHYLMFSVCWWNVIAYQLLQTILTYKTSVERSMAKGRLAITVLSIIFALAFYIFRISLFDNSMRNGLLLLSLAPIMQWCTSLLLFAYYLTFVKELRNTKIHFHVQVGPGPSKTAA